MPSYKEEKGQAFLQIPLALFGVKVCVLVIIWVAGIYAYEVVFFRYEILSHLVPVEEGGSS